MSGVSRRRFIQIVSASAAAAGLRPLAGCRQGDEPDDVFPQGVASGDPTADGVVLWTRVEPRDPRRAEPLRFEVARDERFSSLVASGDLVASPDADHTVRLPLRGLAPNSAYYFRFVSRGVASRVGRTFTAPAPDQDVGVRFAVASCQDYVGRYFHAWNLLDEADDVRFVLFLGDYIYEYESGSDAALEVPPGERRVAFPDGLVIVDEGERRVLAARTLADYRALYRIYASDPDLRRARERFPFVVMWDDHEFANDCWQDHATDFNDARGDEKSPERRAAATRAFWEYQPSLAAYDGGARFPEDLRLWRSLRFGRHVDLYLLDQRYYRSDHVIPEGPVDPEVGKFLANSPLGSRVLARKDAFDAREAGSGVTMLGAEQLDWVVRGVVSSPATWKIIGSPTLLAQMVADLGSFESLPETLRDRYYFKLDHWDGYRTERGRLLAALRGVPDVVCLSGDIHAFYAAELFEDFDAPGETPVAVEFAVSGISASPAQEQVERQIAANPLLQSLGLGDVVPLFDSIVRASGPHFRYASSRANGLAIVAVNRETFAVELREIDDVRSPAALKARSTSFVVRRGRPFIERV